MYMGIDLGTSGVKVIITSECGDILDSASAPVAISRPHALWSEQNPQDWWTATNNAIQTLSSRIDLRDVKAMGIAGQMHGATLLDGNDQIIRPAILWNDGRCEAQCKDIEESVSTSREITGNIMMPGFTAPKLRWVQQNEPENFARIAKVLLPKDYLRFLLSGKYISDMSDAAGTLWMDTRKRQWDTTLLAACGLTTEHMPELVEGNQISAYLDKSIAEQWGMQSIPIVGGAGDNAAGAVGVGLVHAGQAMLSLGTSGVYFVVTDGFQANPDSAVHSFCHALPQKWHLMSVLLSAASCLQWYADKIAQKPVSQLLSELDVALKNESSDLSNDSIRRSPLIFLPYLSGERTPHNDASATGSFFGLTHDTSQAHLTYAVLEGVSLAFADAVDALEASFVKNQALPEEVTLIGGGAKSRLWRQLLATVLDKKLCFREGGEVGPSLGAARLAQLAVDTEKTIDQICPQPALIEEYHPDSTFLDWYKQKRTTFKALYTATKPLNNKDKQ
ncbi:xylulokinase [Alteromonas sp. W364]|uniref:xylulokinase n=1 Tax=Alteromonas sp. W364 TaxID=3075610 RepID=UPI0028853F81|nr:xylulokinase [Alteromonas sp. W364]MDT0628694.1 xylulokinase [Alteromonas sp. W364]